MARIQEVRQHRFVSNKPIIFSAMKTLQSIYDPQTLAQLESRILSLTPDQTPEWGKMTAWQMLRHCNKSEEMYQGKRRYDRLFIGKLFGKMALRKTLKDDKAMSKNSPTHPDLTITGEGDFEQERQQWIRFLKAYQHQQDWAIVHPFFGTMDHEQIGQYVYKHTDHHLRQFGA